MSDQEDFPPSKRIKIEQENVEDLNINIPGPNDTKNDTNSTITDSKSNILTDEKSKDSSASTSQYNNVSHEELQKLREFQVLDEVNEGDSKDEDSDASDKSDDLPEEEIEKMLEEDLPEGYKGAPKPKEKVYVTREKIVLLEKGINHFEVLPLDWMMVRHCSGMPVYMHRGTRVCTLSKPYFLGKGNTRRHDIPISAIPCLAYRKALAEEKKENEIDKSIAEQIANGTWANDPQSSQDANKQSNNQACVQNANSKNIDSSNLGEKQQQNDQHNTDSIDMSNANGSELSNKSDKDETEKTTNLVNEPGQQLSTKSNLPESHRDNVNNDKEKSNSNESTETINNESNSDSNKDTCPLIKDVVRKPVVLPGGIVMPPPRVETVNTSWKTQHLSAEQVNNYCKKLFEFKNVKIMHFKRWADRRKYVKARKTLQYPTLPEGTKLITIPAQTGQDSNGKATKRDWVMNMNGCSYLSVFHEYVRRALQKQPVYEFKQLENAATPYQATVYIGGMQYGVGHGSSKRQAKSAAARASIHILIPEMKDELDEHARNSTSTDTTNNGEPDFTFFDYVGIEDPRIAEFCAATSEPSPHAILRTCLLRNFGAGDRHIHTEMKKLEYQKIELTMRVGKHSASVVCKNKKQAKQRASQAILQALHPHIKSWGSLLRLYGSRSVKSCKEKKLEEQQITLLQDKAQQNEPNYAVLEKLRNEMRKLKERDEAIVPIGTLLVADDLPTHSGSMLNNVDL